MSDHARPLEALAVSPRARAGSLILSNGGHPTLERLACSPRRERMCNSGMCEKHRRYTHTHNSGSILRSLWLWACTNDLIIVRHQTLLRTYSLRNLCSLVRLCSGFLTQDTRAYKTRVFTTGSSSSSIFGGRRTARDPSARD